MWRRVPPDVGNRLNRCLDSAVARASGPVTVFFRADDIGVPGRGFTRLVDTFADNRVPLNAAVVPAWLTPSRWRTIQRQVKQAPDLFCWHQHGWRHANHEASGKKQEFGPQRSTRGIEQDLMRGNHRLTAIMNADFCPVFTPPWNRCDGRTLALLQACGYRAVSRSRASLPEPPGGLAEWSIQVDLHTCRTTDPAAGWTRLMGDLAGGIVQGRCGIMIHHQKMNDPAFDFLDLLLKAMARRRRLRPVRFWDMIANGA